MRRTDRAGNTILGLMLVAAMLLTGCGTKGEEAAETAAPEQTQQETAEQEEAAGQEEAAQQETAENAEAEQETESVPADEEQEATDKMQEAENTMIESYEMPDSDAIALVRDMKIGWNLGNTLDASSDNNRSDELSYESLWCGIKTTKEMIDAVKNAGFRTVRIPVSWHNHVTADGSYTISQVWMDRVQEIVDYAIEDDMYVILNIHHDNNENYIFPDEAHMEQSKAYISAVWEQIADRFASYDEHLIMEGMNEPRLVGTSHEWWLDLNSQDCVQAVECINEFNQTFVDTVRASGGNNAERYLLVPGYAASLQGATNEYFRLPEDPSGLENRIMVEVHAYTPYGFALAGSGDNGYTEQWSMDSDADRAEIDGLMDQLYELYVKNGTGVVIDEFGAREKNGNLQARADFSTYYIGAARARGISCCVWDNNAFSGDGENFGLLFRPMCTFRYPEIIEGLMRYAD